MDLALDLERSCATSIYLYPNNHLPVALLPLSFWVQRQQLVALHGGACCLTGRKK
ncbi:MAG: hypothetical protein RIG68_12460 [Imperialibacter sp.]|uniref:hypothetical protein n=1 Tax=Imperialibacter sp. TaxID=2038411 RepID=UPI0032EC9742